MLRRQKRENSRENEKNAFFGRFSRRKIFHLKKLSVFRVLIYPPGTQNDQEMLCVFYFSVYVNFQTLKFEIKNTAMNQNWTITYLGWGWLNKYRLGLIHYFYVHL